MTNNTYLDSVFVDESNSLAWKLAQVIVQQPCEVYNFVYLYGASGVGKTQMLRMIERELRERHPELNILYTTADEMTDQLIQDLIHKTRDEFNARYRDVQVLLVDDIQHLAGKEATQDEFVKLFDTFVRNNRQCVIASDRPICELVQLNEHLRHRLGSIVSVEIGEPGQKIRREIAERECHRLKLDLPIIVVGYLADQARNPFQILGLVRRIAVYSKMKQIPLDLDHVKECLKEVLEPHPVCANRILDVVCRYYNVECYVLQGNSRTQNIGQARKIAAYLLYRHGKLSIPEIGELLHRDHSTILYAVRWVDAQRKKGEIVSGVLHDLEADIGEGGSE